MLGLRITSACPSSGQDLLDTTPLLSPQGVQCQKLLREHPECCICIVQGAEQRGSSGHFSNYSCNKTRCYLTLRYFRCALQSTAYYEMATSVHHLWIKPLDQNFDLVSLWSCSQPILWLLGCLAASLGT